jgi:hypothetical protein
VPVDVAALERLPLLWSQPGRGRERGQRLVADRELGCDRGDLLGGKRTHRARRRLWVSPGEDGGVAVDVLPADGGAEDLAQRLGDPVSRPGREPSLPGGDLVGHVLELVQPHVAEGSYGVAKSVA